MRLPPELRTQIYEYVFSGADILVLTLFRRYKCTIDVRKKHFSLLILSADAFDLRTALTRTCRQIHRETRLLPFKHGTFDNIWLPTDFARWLGIVDEVLGLTAWTALSEKQREWTFRNGGTTGQGVSVDALRSWDTFKDLLSKRYVTAN